jgi:hypothetical protein
MHRSALALAIALTAACGDGAPEETDAVTGSGTTAPDGYPEGPYGADVGEIAPNLEWRGYARLDGAGPANEVPYAPFSLDDARRSGKPWALLHTGAVF